MKEKKHRERVVVCVMRVDNNLAWVIICPATETGYGIRSVLKGKEKKIAQFLDTSL